MIIDGFTFFNELDLLELRLEELYPVVDLFVLVQSDLTFRGNPKPFYFDREAERWARYRNKIREFRMELPPTVGAWDRERLQRNGISEVIKSEAYYEPDAICLISDLDEIPRREAVEALNVDHLRRFPARLEMRAYYYALNVRVGNEGSVRAVLADDLTTADDIRHSNPSLTIPNAGWHFSYLGDAEFISNKIRSFSHSELDIPTINDINAINDAIDNHRDLYGRGDYMVETIDDTWPHAVKNNPEKWEKYVWRLT